MKNRKIYLILSIVVILDLCLCIQNVSATTSISEEWYRTWGGNGDVIATTVKIDSSDNIYIAGYSYFIETPQNSYNHIHLIKYDSSGVQLWNQTWKPNQFNRCNGMTIGPLDNIYLVGDTKADLCLLKYNCSGVLQWNRTWDGGKTDWGSAIVLDSSDNIYITGTTYSSEAGGYNVCILKYDKSGLLQWNRTWSGIYGDNGEAIILDSFNNVYVAGVTTSFGEGENDIFLLKYDSSGVLQWNKTWGGSSFDWCGGIGSDSLDNIYIVGTTVNFGEGEKEIVLIKYDSSGVLQWNKTWGGIEDDIGDAIILDSSDDIFIGGLSKSFNKYGRKEIVFLKYDNSGVLQWNSTWSGFGFSYTAMAIDSSDNIYLAGYRGDNMCLVKLQMILLTSISGYNSLFLIGLICIISVILIKKCYKLNKKT